MSSVALSTLAVLVCPRLHHALLFLGEHRVQVEQVAVPDLRLVERDLPAVDVDVAAARGRQAVEVPTGALRRSVPAACAATAASDARKSLAGNDVLFLREQEAGGSNPLAPTTSHAYQRTYDVAIPRSDRP